MHAENMIDKGLIDPNTIESAYLMAKKWTGVFDNYGGQNKNRMVINFAL
jgi:hypothetical protein